MELAIHQSGGGHLHVSETVFAVDYKEGLIHQVVTAHFARARSGTKAQKTRAEVSGGNSKPFRQKGTGRARAGTTRGPLWRGGGRTFAAQPRDYEQKVNRKMYRGAMRSILSELIRQERLIIVDSLTIEAPKTKQLKAKLASLELNNVLIITDVLDSNLALASSNMYQVDVTTAQDINPINLIAFDKVLATAAAMRQIEERLQ